MGKSTAFGNAMLKLFFQATAIANLADNASVGPLTNLYVSLHTADPGVGGSQSTNEMPTIGPYTNYARVTVARSNAGFTVTGEQVSFVANVAFPQPVAGDGTTVTATYFAIGTQVSGAGMILYSGPLAPGIPCTVGQVPIILAASNVTES